jgi:hypothetical protein
MLSLWTTRAVCPTLRRLGALVLQDVLATGVGVAASGTVVGVSSAGEAVGLGASVVGGSVAARVAVGDGAAVVGELVGSAVWGSGDGTLVSVASAETGAGKRVLVGTGATVVVAHPRRSIRMRMSARMTVTIVLNRS